MNERKSGGNISVERTVWCAGCEQWYQEGWRLKKTFVLVIRQQGWNQRTQNGELLWFCPECLDPSDPSDGSPGTNQKKNVIVWFPPGEKAVPKTKIAT